MITIHDKYENDFSKNGFGDISQNILNPEVSWKMNGEFKVSFSYPIFAKHSQHLLDENIVRVPVPYMDDQLFRIYKPNKELGYVEVEARHIFYDLLTNFIEDTNIVGQHGDGAIKQLLNRTVLPHKFYGSSDISTMANMRVVRYNPVEALLDDGKANTFISRWGGQLYRDNFNVRMDRRIGSNRGVTIQYKKDLLGFDASIDHSSKINRLMPIGFDGLILPEKYIDSPNIDMNDIRIGVVRYQDVKAAIGQYEEDEDAIPLEDAYELLRQGAAKEFTENKIDQPVSSFKVDFVTLENTKEYEEFSYLQEIRQGDTVRVSVPDEGIDVESIMVEFKSSPLRKNHYDSVTLGSFTDSLTSSVPKLSIIRQELDEHNELIISSMLAANRKNRLFFGTRNPNELQLVGLTLGDTYFQEDGDWFAIWEYVEVNGERYWRKGPNTDFGKELETEIASVISQAETDRQNAQQAADKAFEDAKDYADSEVLRIESEISQDVGNALSIAQQALDDVSAQANQALVDAKAHAEAEDTRIRGELELEIGDAIDLAEQAKQDAIDKSNQAYEDAVAEADRLAAIRDDGITISAGQITAGTIDAARLDTVSIVTSGLTADAIKSTHIHTSTATIDKLFANETVINRLTSKTAFIDSIKAVEIDAGKITSGTINSARINTSDIVTKGLTANVIKSTHISADTALFDKLFSTTSATDRLSARSAWIKNANIADASIDGAKIQDATIGSAKIANIDASKISTGTLDGISITGGDVYLRNSSGIINAGMSSSGTTNTSTRIWAGSDYSGRGSAAFRVQQNGKMIANNAEITGKITSDTGTIGIFDIKPGEIEARNYVENWHLRIGAPYGGSGGGKSPFWLGGGSPITMRAMIYPDGAIQTFANLMSNSILPNNSSGIIGASATNNRFYRIYLQSQPNVSSDVRQKKSIQDIPEGLIEKLKDLEPKMFKQSDDEDEVWHFGYIAQDVERVLYKYAIEEVGYEDAQEYVKDFAFLHKDESYLSLLYGEIAVLREKEMRDRIAKLELQIEELKGV